MLDPHARHQALQIEQLLELDGRPDNISLVQKLAIKSLQASGVIALVVGLEKAFETAPIATTVAMTGSAAISKYYQNKTS